MSNHEIISAEDPAEEPHDARPDSAANPEPQPNRRQRRANQHRIPAVNECLIALAQLPGLVATRVLTPAQANSIRGHFETILRYHPQSQHGQSPQLMDEHVLKLLRDQPELIELLEPLLTQEQIDAIMREVRNDEHRQA